MTVALLIGAALMLAAGIFLQIWSLQPARVGAQYSLQLPVVFLYGLGGGALLLFISFPDSVSEGQAIGFSLGGAAGFVAFFMLCSFAWLSKTRNVDSLSKKIADLEIENKSLSRNLIAIERKKSHTLPPLRHDRISCQINEERKFKIGFITGDLASVIGIDVWVNSENTHMEMSRITEPTISATVRYLGAMKDDRGKIVRDVIADELSQLMGAETYVPSGHVLTTTAGAIKESHRANRLLHVAAVEGEPRQGYRPVRDIGSCVRALLSEIDRLNRNGEHLESVIIPLLGTGGGNSDLPRTARVMISTCVDYLLSHRDSEVQVIYLLAHTGAHVAACEHAIKQEPRLATHPNY